MMEGKIENGSLVVEGLALPPKHFSTGSEGWYASEKLDVGDARYQCGFQAVLVGSKKGGVGTPTTELNLGTQVIFPHDFKTGSRGFFTTFRTMVRVKTDTGNDWTFPVQVQLQATLIGSKPVTVESLTEKWAAQDARRKEADAKREAARLAQLEALGL